MIFNLRNIKGFRLMPINKRTEDKKMKARVKLIKPKLTKTNISFKKYVQPTLGMSDISGNDSFCQLSNKESNNTPEMLNIFWPLLLVSFLLGKMNTIFIVKDTWDILIKFRRAL